MCCLSDPRGIRNLFGFAPRPARPDADAVIIVAGLTGDDPEAGHGRSWQVSARVLCVFEDTSRETS